MTELGRQYRRANRGDLPWADAAAACRLLRELRSMLETSELEQRLARLEQVVEQRRALPPVNGAMVYGGPKRAQL